MVEQDGGPLGFAIAGANVHDTKLLAATIDAIVVKRPDPAQVTQHLCLDKGYDNPTGEAACADGGYVAHIRRIGEEKLDDQGDKTHPARRWVVERTWPGCRSAARSSSATTRKPPTTKASSNSPAR